MQWITNIFKQRKSFLWKYRKCPFLLGITWMAMLVVFWVHPLNAQKNDLERSLPPLQPHPLPLTLVEWQDPKDSGDYFDQISLSPAGYLIWSQFPVKFYLDRPTNLNDPAAASTRRFRQWVDAVMEAITEWQDFFPLVEVKDPQLADIVIERTEPPLDARFDPKTGQLEIPRARSAQTSYNFYLTQDNSPILRHRMTIKISPGLSQSSTLSASRHELGHGLGIWGHSNQETDALYFSQVRRLSPISVRDINTLKKIYQQPTRLGWKLP
ncbi:peptidase metallopeptidase [cyanobacterium endosymbiont of Rhopalodia gibberula]|uniref:peptidase n=1 Tax=cyanobacterium endosymbiont of Rhopalodia gibberula TaxID=1763363 RepID=UPI000DC723E8|nr:peptidase [cyanobacterium endosymbiont of Rhopalodia gibberula]BBA79858.1 peptidase metallopeptidase [cyanobacterium endosymbiont of Rhopalodia gibberula]